MTAPPQPLSPTASEFLVHAGDDGAARVQASPCDGDELAPGSTIRKFRIVQSRSRNRELVDTVRQNVTSDWAVKESVRAKLRVIVKRILRNYGYPPDKQEVATNTVHVPRGVLLHRKKLRQAVDGAMVSSGVQNGTLWETPISRADDGVPHSSGGHCASAAGGGCELPL